MTTLTPVPYQPGQTRAAGYFRRCDLPVQDLVDQLTEDGIEPPKPPDPPLEPRIRLRRMLQAFLVLAAILVFAIDRMVGFPRNVFGFLIVYALLGIILVGVATRDRTPGKTNALRRHPVAFAIGGIVGSVFPCSWLWAPFFGHSRSIWLLAFALAVAFALAALPDAWLDASNVRRDRPDRRLTHCREVLEALVPDVQPGKPVDGWIDLTGPEQDVKVLRRGKSASGAEVNLYRDEWWRARLRLRDGNSLRISAVERLRATADRWKQGRSRRKLKPGKKRSVTSIEIRLDVNATAYRTKPAATATPAQVGALQLTTLTAGEAAVSAVAVSAVAVCPGADFKPSDVLSILAILYSSLEPVKRTAGGGA